MVSISLIAVPFAGDGISLENKISSQDFQANGNNECTIWARKG
jgi:hypothetical protein